MKNIPLYQDTKREETIFALREALDAVGLNFSTFARKYGWDARYVNLTAWTYWDTGIIPPKGIKMRRILKALEQEISAVAHHDASVTPTSHPTDMDRPDG